MGKAIAEQLAISKKYLVFHFDRKLHKNRHSIACSSIPIMLKKAEVVILAVKPQNFIEIKEDLIQSVAARHTVVSIMGGVSLRAISAKLNCKNIIRSMPNLALRYQASLTGWFAHPECSKRSSRTAKEIFLLWGRDIKCRKENQLNDITAAAGSGPSYFLMIADLIYRYCRKRGFDEKKSLLISRQVLKGADRCYSSMPIKPLEIIKKITSKGGTTEAAFKCFKQQKVENKIMSGIIKAGKRAKELEKILNK